MHEGPISIIVSRQRLQSIVPRIVCAGPKLVVITIIIILIIPLVIPFIARFGRLRPLFRLFLRPFLQLSLRLLLRTRTVPFQRPLLGPTIGITIHYVVEAETHHLPSTCNTAFNPDQRFLIAQTFLAGVATFATGRKTIVANDAATAASIAALRHGWRLMIPCGSRRSSLVVSAFCPLESKAENRWLDVDSPSSTVHAAVLYI